MGRAYISLGFQCTVPTVLEKAGLKGETLPFDWLLNTPEFVYSILKKLLEPTSDIEDIVRQDFFKCDSGAYIKRNSHNNTVETEHFQETDLNTGPCLYNTKYGVIFPHDHLTEEDIQKYIRRFIRLKNLLYDNNIELYFVYISQSSITEGNFTINGVHKINNTYNFLNKIHELILSIRDNFKIIMMDAIQSEDNIILDKSKIKYIPIEPKPIWFGIVDECVGILRHV